MVFDDRSHRDQERIARLLTMKLSDYAIKDAAGTLGVSLYIRIANSLRTRIYQGEWLPGKRLPPLEELADNYGVALNTLRKAVEILSAQSLVTSARGVGTVVTVRSAQWADRDLRAALSDPLSVTPDHRIAVLENSRVDEITPELRGQYGVASSYQRVFKTQAVGDMPYVVLEVFVEYEVFARFPKGAEHARKLSQLLRETSGVGIARSRQELTVQHSEQQTSELLGYPIAAPLIRLRRWRLTSDDKIVYACTGLYRSDLFVWDVTQEERDGDATLVGTDESVNRT
jgi:GntR family transcriptional regulator